MQNNIIIQSRNDFLHFIDLHLKYPNLNNLLNKDTTFNYSYNNTIYTIPYNIITEGELLQLCINKINQLLIFIYPNLTNEILSSFVNSTMITQYLLPFINNFNDLENIKSLDEIYNKKDDETHYHFSNYQFDHRLLLDNKVIDYHFNTDDFLLNANAIFKTIIVSENRLFTNWVNVFPYSKSLDDFKISSYYNRHNILPQNINFKYNILESPINDTLFYENTIKNLKNYNDIFNKKEYTNKNYLKSWNKMNSKEKNDYYQFIITNARLNNTSNSLEYLFKTGTLSDIILPEKNNLPDFKHLTANYLFEKNRNKIIDLYHKSYFSFPIMYNYPEFIQYRDLHKKVNMMILNDFINQNIENRKKQYDKEQYEKIKDIKLFDFYIKLYLQNNTDEIPLLDFNTINNQIHTFKLNNLVLDELKELNKQPTEFKELYTNFISTLLNLLKDNELKVDNHTYINYKIQDSNDTEYFVIEKRNNKYYFINTDKFNGYLYDNWGNFFSMYYLEQINIFNKYLNKRIIFATGGTGTGKSTQLPKLLMYSSIIFDNKYDYHILCSEPRQKPTGDNATIISRQLSCPLFFSDLFTNKKIEKGILNYNVQFQHGDDKKHYIANPNYSTLTFATDQIVLNNVLNNPMCYESIIQTDKNTKQNKVSFNRKYNMIIVDEAHEHNVNMDLILSIMKQYCFIDNDLKLVIISATMDADEPIYRQFYDNINDIIGCNYDLIDNQQFLLSRGIDQLNSDNNQKLYSVIDRRLDISEPGKLNIYKIVDIYKDLTNDQLKDENYKNKVILNILQSEINNKNTHDILIFKDATPKINKLVKLLNETMPANVLAVPYYSKLNDSIKEFVEKKMFSLIKNIHIDKTVDLSKEKDKEIFFIGKGNYNHIIYVATNIAEASITLPNLSHVIDDGIQQTLKFNQYLDADELEAGYIADTNRLQRRGRVGRRSDGTVYYLYTKDFLKDVKQEYSICNIDISNYLLNMFNNNKSIDINEFNKNNKNVPWINSYNTNKQYSYLKIEETKLKQYYQIIYDNILLYFNEVKGEDNITYSCGLKSYILLDMIYNFYVISPNQHNLKRDIFYNIIFEKDPIKLEKKILNQYEYLELVKKHEENNKLYNIIKQDKNDILSEYSKNKTNNVITKTDNFDLINSITMQSKILDRNLQFYIIGIGLAANNNCFNEFIVLCSILINASYFTKIFEKNNNNDNLLMIYRDYIKHENKYLTKEEIDKINDTIEELNECIRKNKTIFSQIKKSYQNIINIPSDLSKLDKINIIFMYLFKSNIIVKMNENLYFRRSNIFDNDPRYLPFNKNYIITAKHKYINVNNPKEHKIMFINTKLKFDDDKRYYLYFSKIIKRFNIEAFISIEILHDINPELLKYINLDTSKIHKKLNEYIENDNFRNALNDILFYVEK